jgi:prolycopene isomerase
LASGAAGLRDELPRTPLTPSIFQVHLGVDMDLEPYRNQIKRLNFIYPYDDIDRAMGNFPRGNVEEAAFFLYVATFHQPEMAPAGKHSLKLEAYTRLDSTGIDWERDKQEIGDVFIRRSEQLIPHLGEHIVTRVHRTPLDLQRDTGNAEGAFAGWSFAPEQLSRGRPFQRTPVPGLYLAGHWTTPSAGVPWVMLSGYNTASMILGDRMRGRRLAGRRNA